MICRAKSFESFHLKEICQVEREHMNIHGLHCDAFMRMTQNQFVIFNLDCKKYVTHLSISPNWHIGQPAIFKKFFLHSGDV